MSGKVWLVGAGPGDAGLLTLRGKEVLEQADVVVCDALISPGVRALIPDSARLLDAGQRSGKLGAAREDLSRVLLREAQAGKRVVRLKCGDPFLFGRGDEELEALSANNVPFEIVPGVTGALAIPAYFGIPVTRREFSSGVRIITERQRGGAEFDYAALFRNAETLVFLMKTAELSEICAGLIQAGADPSTPAALLEEGTTARQRGTFSTLGGLEEACPNPRTPALIVVGEVCRLSDRFAWRDAGALSGMRVAVTRPKALAADLARRLREEGAEVLEIPAIETRPIANNRALSDALRNLLSYDWIAFTSPTAVRTFFDALLQVSDARALSDAKIAAIGPGTRRALRDCGVRADFTPSAYDAAAMGRELAELCPPDTRILIPRAAKGHSAPLTDALRRVPCAVEEIAIYETVPAPCRALDLKALIASGGVDFVTFTSASTVSGFASAVKGVDFTKIRAVCIGERTAAKAQALKMRVWTAKEATLDALISCAEEAAEAIRSERDAKSESRGASARKTDGAA